MYARLCCCWQARTDGPAKAITSFLNRRKDRWRDRSKEFNKKKQKGWAIKMEGNVIIRKVKKRCPDSFIFRKNEIFGHFREMKTKKGNRNPKECNDITG